MVDRSNTYIFRSTVAASWDRAVSKGLIGENANVGMSVLLSMEVQTTVLTSICRAGFCPSLRSIIERPGNGGSGVVRRPIRPLVEGSGGGDRQRFKAWFSYDQGGFLVRK